MRSSKKKDNFNEFSINEKSIGLAIKLNFNAASEDCPICAKPTNPTIGAELTLAENSLVVCRDCGSLYAPLLAALLDLSEMATHLYLTQDEFGNQWQEDFYRCQS